MFDLSVIFVRASAALEVLARHCKRIIGPLQTNSANILARCGDRSAARAGANSANPCLSAAQNKHDNKRASLPLSPLSVRSHQKLNTIIVFVLDIQQSKAEERERHAAKPTKQTTHAHVAHLTDAIVRSTDLCRSATHPLNEFRSHGFLGVLIKGINISRI